LSRSLLSTAFLPRRMAATAALLLLVVVIGACMPILETSWGSVTVIGDPAKLLLAFNDRIVMIDPLNGTPLNFDQARDVEIVAAATAAAEADPTEATPAPEIEAEPTRVPTLAVNAQGQIAVWEIRPQLNLPLHFYTPPLILDDDTLLVTAYENRLFEVRAETGTSLSTTTLPGQVIGRMLLTDDLLYVPLNEGDLLALRRLSNGAWEEVWRYDTEHGIYAQPLLIGGVLYVATLDHYMIALDPATGTEIWELELNGALASSPLLYNDELYIGSFGRTIYRLSLDGEILGEYTTRDWVWGTPTIYDGVLYAADLGGFVYALDISGGRNFMPIWGPRQVASRGIRATPLVTEDRIVVGSRDRNVYCLERATGTEFLRREVRGEVLADLVLLEPSEQLRIGEPLVLVSTMAREQMLTAFTLNEGISRWSYGR